MASPFFYGHESHRLMAAWAAAADDHQEGSLAVPPPESGIHTRADPLRQVGGFSSARVAAFADFPAPRSRLERTDRVNALCDRAGA